MTKFPSKFLLPPISSVNEVHVADSIFLLYLYLFSDVDDEHKDDEEKPLKIAKGKSNHTTIQILMGFNFSTRILEAIAVFIFVQSLII